MIGSGVRIGAQCRIYPRAVVYPGNDNRRSRDDSRGRCFGRGRFRLRSRRGDRRVHAVPAAGDAGYRRRCRDRGRTRPLTAARWARHGFAAAPSSTTWCMLLTTATSARTL
ncbi:MAG: hypothetical protein WDM87_08210 [Terracidiphilus sp.]